MLKLLGYLCIGMSFLFCFFYFKQSHLEFLVLLSHTVAPSAGITGLCHHTQFILS